MQKTKIAEKTMPTSLAPCASNFSKAEGRPPTGLMQNSLKVLRALREAAFAFSEISLGAICGRATGDPHATQISALGSSSFAQPWQNMGWNVLAANLVGNLDC